MAALPLSEAKELLAEILRKSNEQLRLFVIQEEGYPLQSWVVGEKLVEIMLEEFSCGVEWEQEKDIGIWTVYVPELDIWGTGNTKDEAAEDLVSAVQDYMEVFLESIPFYLGAGRKKHLPYIFRLLLAKGNRKKIKEFLGLA